MALRGVSRALRLGPRYSWGVEGFESLGNTFKKFWETEKIIK